MEDFSQEYREDGAILIKGLFDQSDFKDVLSRLIKEISSFINADYQSNEWIDHTQKNPADVTKLYDQLVNCSEAEKLARNPKIIEAVKKLLPEQQYVYKKIPFRIDVPFETKELAFWHQDDFYVQGAPNELTVWIPLQDTPAHVGALSVIKGSHKNGKIDHTLKVGKKTLPVGVYDKPINIIEMKFGDALFFSSYTMHTSNLNISNNIRYSLQIRYGSTQTGTPSELMGGFNLV